MFSTEAESKKNEDVFSTKEAQDIPENVADVEDEPVIENNQSVFSTVKIEDRIINSDEVSSNEKTTDEDQ